MPLTLALTLACAAATCGADQSSPKAETPVTTASADSSAKTEPANAPSKPTPAKLVAFDGAHDFLKTSRRLRIWREAVDFDMTIDAAGEATECKVVNEFRKNYVNKKLCEVAMEHHTFEPARNAQNEAVQGSYRAHLSYAALREELD